MINIEQITSRLAKMPDQSLQQYAMMHKGDPYIIALAMSESKRRKDMRASAQAGPAQAQPKVVDQALMDMAPQAAQPAMPQAAPQSPDEAGIASLPAGEMNFADGGIVERYDDRGLVRPYETPFDRSNREAREAAEAARKARDIIPYGGVYSGEGGQYSAEPLTARELAGADPYAAFKKFSAFAGRNVEVDPVTGETVRKAAAPAAAAAVAPATYDPAQATRRSMYPPQEAAPGAAPKPKADAGLGGTREAAALRAPAGPSAEEAKKIAGQFLDTKAAETRYAKFYEDEKAAAAAARARREEGKPTGEAGTKAEAALKAEEAGAAKEKDEAIGVAIFKAGLGMMAGTSPNAFANIGKGAMAGLEDYSGAMKDMKKAAKERQKAFAEIENARRAESRDDWKTAQTFEDKADARMAKAREFGVKGIMDITGKDAEIASGIYKTQVEQKGRMDVAQVQAAAMKDRGAGGGEKQTLAELKALQGSLSTQLKTEFNKDQRAAINAQLSRVNAEIAKMAGLGTMSSAPGAASPGGTSTTGWGKAQVITP